MILAILAIWWAFYVYHKAISMPLFNFKSKPNCNIQYKFIFDHFLNYADRLRAACHIFPISTYQKVTCQKSGNGIVFKNGIVHKCLYRFQCVEIFVHIFLLKFLQNWDARRPQYLSHKYFWKTFTGVCLTGVAMYWLYNFRAKID